MFRTTLAWASFVLLIAVAFGAFGAHGLKARLTPDELGQWHTSVQYQFYHGLAMLGLIGIGDRIRPKSLVWARNFFLLGILCFSGSLYLLSTRSLLDLHSITPFLGPITPVGGLFFMAGWSVLLITALRPDRSH
ncbi:MAG: DUF423 domain-containing protein [Bacteroidota bacterium]|nr:DUF423 domain-containing protein [Bacteroidota bacterium]